MDMLNAIGRFSSVAKHISLNDQTHTMELDGQKQTLICYLAKSRIELLNAQINSLFTNHSLSHAFGWTSFLATQYVTSKFVYSFMVNVFQNYCRLYRMAHKDEPTTMYCTGAAIGESLAEYAMITGSYIASVVDPLLPYSTLFLNTVTCVMYVASIALGHTIYGSIGLAAMGVILLKRYQLLPEWINHYLQLISACTNPIVCCFIFTQSNFLAKLFAIPELLLQMSDLLKYVIVFLKDYELLPYLPEKIQNALRALPGSFSSALREQIPANIFDLCSDKTAFQVNLDFIYAPEIDQIIPKNVKEDSRTNQQLIDALNNKITQDHIILSPKERNGLERITRGLVFANFDGTAPTNANAFTAVLRDMIIRILRDNENFELNFKDLVGAGSSCADGWTRNLEALACPHSDDIRWSVHYMLARLRSQMLIQKPTELVSAIRVETNCMKQETSRLEKISNSLFMQACVLGMTNAIDQYLQNAGGENNVHFNTALQRSLRSWARPARGEMNYHEDPPSLFDVLLNNYYAPTLKDISIHFTETENIKPAQLFSFVFPFLYARNEVDIAPLLILLPIACLTGGFPSILTTFKQDHLIHKVDEAIKPSYNTAAHEERRDISWKAITNWSGDFFRRLCASRGIQSGSLAEEIALNQFNDAVYQTNQANVTGLKEAGYQTETSFLKETGVRLLLWDIGILDLV